MPAGGSGALDRNTNVYAKKVAVTGGATDGAVIGGTTPAAGSFTTLAASGAATLSGALTVSGDVTLSTAGAIKMTNLPSSDPSVAGQLYTDSTGQVIVSAG